MFSEVSKVIHFQTIGYIVNSAFSITLIIIHLFETKEISQVLGLERGRNLFGASSVRPGTEMPFSNSPRNQPVFKGWTYYRHLLAKHGTKLATPIKTWRIKPSKKYNR